MYAIKILFAFALIGVASYAFSKDSQNGADPYYDQLGNPKLLTATKKSLLNSFSATLQPNIGQGYILGDSSLSRGYVVEVTPLSSANADGSAITQVIQNEFGTTTNKWIDVLRLTLLHSTIPVNVKVSVYKVN